MGDSFNDWLTPSLAELNSLRFIDQLLESNKFVQARTFLHGLDQKTLIKYTELSKKVKEFCNQKDQDFIWQKHLQDMSEEGFTIKEYPPLLLSQLVKGIYYYWLAVEYRDNKNERFGENELIFLNKSAENHCFYAYNSLSTWAYEAYKMGNANSSLLALEYAKAASDFHWTPGYILLYKIFVNLAVLNDSSIQLYQHALEAIIVANKISENPYSIDAINNAYFGNGLIEGNKNQFNSWSKVMDQIISDGQIPAQLVNDIYDRATKIANNIIKKVDQNENRVIDTDNNVSNSNNFNI